MKEEKMRKKIRRYLAQLLCFVLLLGTVPVAGPVLKAEAGGDSIPYISYSYNGERNTLTRGSASASGVTHIQSNTDKWGNGNVWYIVNSNITISERVQVFESVNLILCDRATLTCEKGIRVSENCMLRIFAQSEGKDRGKLIVNGVDGAGIGGNKGTTPGDAGENCGNVYIHGGDISISGNGGAGIGGGDGYGTASGGNGGRVTVFAGSIKIDNTSPSSGSDSGIGGGAGFGEAGGAGGTTEIHGGEVTIKTADGIAGIGGGRGLGNGSGTELVMTGGSVSASSIGCEELIVEGGSHGSIALGWRNAGDSFYVGQYNDSAIDISLRNGKDFWYSNGPSNYTDVNPDGLTALAGKTLYPKGSYAITEPAPSEHGSISVASRAFKGDDVPIIVSPDDHYSITQVTVARNDGSQLAVSGYDNEYSFTMPESDVKILQFSFVPGVIVEQPQDLVLTEGYTDGNKLTIRAEAPAEYDLSYNWYISTDEGNPIASASECMIETGKQAGTTEYYYCRVSVHNKASDHTQDGQIISRTAKVTIVAAPPSYYNVRFVMNGYGEPISSQRIRSGQRVKRPADPVAEGVSFGGWYTDATLSTEYNFDRAVTRSFTLYAKWTEEKSVSFNVSFDMQKHGEQIPSQSVLSGNTAARPADPEAEGYDFGGWYTDAACTTEYDFTTAVTSDLILYAKWTEKEPQSGPEEGEAAMDPVALITEDTTELWLVQGQKFTLPEKGWSPATKKDKNYVSISKKAVLKAKKAGSASINLVENGEVKRSISLNISKPKIDKKLTVKTGEEPKPIGLNFDSEHLDVYWYSASPDVATVDQEGRVTAVGRGKATVTAYINGSAYKCTVTVKEPEPAKERTLHMTVGATKTLSIRGVKKPVWNSASEDIAHFETKNKLKADAAGETLLTATAGDGTEYRVYLTVEDTTLSGNGLEPVKKKNGKTVSNRYTLTLKSGETTQLSFAAVDRPVVFKSSRPDSAFIGLSGHVTARAAGKSRFTTKLNGKTISIDVVVQK
ncbi:MAG: InlB B-repeat-containing protein [Lachnospiraceae bacterium]|nr:InlB B-repeat-containing protein [Lachnospiraceae bacterium]